MTQEALADRVCSAADVARFESGQAEPPERLLREFAVRLSCPISYLRNGVPLGDERRIEATFTVAEQVLRRVDASAALQRYTELRTNPATVLLGRRVDAEIGVALAREQDRDYTVAEALFRHAAAQLWAGDGRWVTCRAAMIRCQRLAGDLAGAENMVRTSILPAMDLDDEPIELANTLFSAERLTVYADRGNPTATRREAAVLASGVGTLRHEVRFEVYRNLAYAATRTGDSDMVLQWVSQAYSTGSAYGLQPAARLVADCIDLLQAIPQPEASAAALADFRRQVTTRQVPPNKSARRLGQLMRAQLRIGALDTALQHCDALLDEAIGASPWSRLEVVNAYGEVLAAVGLRSEEAAVAMREASDLLQGVPFIKASGLDSPKVQRSESFVRKAPWLGRALFDGFRRRGSGSRAVERSSYRPPREPPTEGGRRRGL
ncbi:hypothetical protein GCM10029978_066290 [Actinoallomurus acanthiterrae]